MIDLAGGRISCCAVIRMVQMVTTTVPMAHYTQTGLAFNCDDVPRQGEPRANKRESVYVELMTT